MPSRVSADPLVESGDVSDGSSQGGVPEIYFTTLHLTFLNRQLQNLEPQGKPTCCPHFAGP